MFRGGLSEEATFERRFEGWEGARRGMIWGQGAGRSSSRCKGSGAEKRLTCKRRRKHSALEAGRTARGVRDEASEEGLTDLTGGFHSENHVSRRGLLSRLVTWPNGGCKILRLRLVTVCRGTGIEAGI